MYSMKNEMKRIYTKPFLRATHATLRVHTNPWHSSRTRQQGFGYVEYFVLLLGMVFVLFAPLPGHGGENVVDYVLNAIRAFSQNSSLLLSIP